MHPWGAGGSTSPLEGRQRHLPMRGLLVAAMAAARQQNYSGGVVGVGGGGVAAHLWVGGGVLAMLHGRVRR